MYENIILFDENIEFDSISDSESDISSSGDSLDSIDYEELGDIIYQNTYNAMRDYYEDHPQTSVTSEFIDSPAIEWATDTDSRLYTGSLTVAPTSSAQQSAAYLLDIRNVLLIFLLGWFVLTVYSKIKNLFINYFGG